jgi:aerobic C4-dicarboxylate transport protein
MSMARGTTNMIGNGIATIIIARWDGALDLAQLRRVLGGGPAPVVEPVAAVKIEPTAEPLASPKAKRV